MEWLAVDQHVLLKTVLEKLDREIYFEPIVLEIDRLKKQTVNTINHCIGTRLLVLLQANNDMELLPALYNHNSDIVRCWATYMISSNKNLSLKEKFETIKVFANDHHFGVREISWLAFRSLIIEHLDDCLLILENWSRDSSLNIRRFASESIRPRGVWCEHIETLKINPEKALRILENLKSDEARYVQDSVGNWLNDASKSKPNFVIEICKKWESDSPTKFTKYIIKKALRTVDKA